MALKFHRIKTYTDRRLFVHGTRGEQCSKGGWRGCDDDPIDCDWYHDLFFNPLGVTRQERVQRSGAHYAQPSFSEVFHQAWSTWKYFAVERHTGHHTQYYSFFLLSIAAMRLKIAKKFWRLWSGYRRTHRSLWSWPTRDTKAPLSPTFLIPSIVKVRRIAMFLMCSSACRRPVTFGFTF